MLMRIILWHDWKDKVIDWMGTGRALIIYVPPHRNTAYYVVYEQFIFSNNICKWIVFLSCRIYITNANIHHFLTWYDVFATRHQNLELGHFSIYTFTSESLKIFLRKEISAQLHQVSFYWHFKRCRMACHNLQKNAWKTGPVHHKYIQEKIYNRKICLYAYNFSPQ